MPIFEYRCTDCGTRFEKLIRRSSDTEALQCPSCGEKHLSQELSTFAAHAASPKPAPGPAGCPGGMCPNPGMCGRN